MRIYALIEGGYGRRIVENIIARGPSKWEVKVHEFKETFPLVIDEPEEYVPKDCPESDLILSLCESSSIIQLLPEIAKKTGAKAVIVAVDNPAWVPLGLQRQMEGELAKIGVAYAFPKPLCSLTETGDQWVDEFARFFGKPKFAVKGKDVVEEVIVERGAPCGSTWFVAERLKGVKIADAKQTAGLLLHNYPCLASMQIDLTVGDTILHLSGGLIKSEVRRNVCEMK
jgi:hypothetical protein